MSCPVKGCHEIVRHDRLMCYAHWRLVPLPLQKTIYRLWNSGKPKSGHIDACTSAVEQVNERVARATGS